MKKILYLLLIQIVAFSTLTVAQTDSTSTDSLALTDTIKTRHNVVLNISVDTLYAEDAESEQSLNPSEGNMRSNMEMSVSSSMSSASAEAGRTIGSLDVSPSGSATYTVPIAVPPGINGLVPQISLSYSSQGGNGLAGYGWNIAGLSSISRVPRTRFHDNIVGGTNVDANDRFALDGQRLILKSGTYGADGAEYQTEHYSNLKIISKGTSAYGPDYFEVYYPDGSIAVYGSSADSQTATEYAITYSENPQGIRISYNYLNSDNTMSIFQISYGAKGMGSPINHINFTYINRASKELAYAGGHSLYQTQLLTTITVEANGADYRRYDLTHDIVSGMAYQRLTSIQEWSGDGTSSFDPINFQYNNTPYSYLQRTQVPDMWISNIKGSNSKVVASYFNDNSTTDFFVYPNSKDKIYGYWDPTDSSDIFDLGAPIYTGSFEEIIPVTFLSHNDKIFPNQGIALVKHIDESTTKFQVLFEDSKQLYQQYSKEWAAPLSPSYYSECSGTTQPGGRIERDYLSGDFNGDGLTDVLAVSKAHFEVTGGFIDYWECVGEPEQCCYYTKQFVTDAAVHFIDLDRRLASNFVHASGTFTAPYVTEDKLYTGDFNGDGKTDILHVTAGAMYVYTLDASNNITLLWNKTGSPITSNPNFQPMIADFNGDGKTDVIFPTTLASYSNYATYNNPSQAYAVFLSTGTAFEKIVQNFPFGNSYIPKYNGHAMQIDYVTGDYNNDGKADIIQYTTHTYDGQTQGSLRIATFNNVSGSSISSPVLFQNGANFPFYTTNLVHFPIPLFLSNEKPNYNLQFGMLSDHSMQLFKFQKDLKKDVEIKAVVQDAITQYIDYKPLATESAGEDIQIYEGGYSQTYPFMDIRLAPGLKVVSKLRRNYNGHDIQQVFGYRNAVSNTEGLGFLGFGETIRSNWHTDYSDVNRMFTVNINDPTLRGAPLRAFTTKNIYMSSTVKDMPGIDADIILNQPSTVAQTVTALNSIRLTQGFRAKGTDGTFIAKIASPATGISDGATLSDYITRTDYTYKTELLTSKVFVNVPLSVATKDLLNQTNTTQLYTYDSYYNPTKEVSRYSGAGTKTTDITYANSTGSTYYIGRPLTKKTTLGNGSDTYTSEEQYTYSGYLPTQVKKKGHGTNWITEDLVYDTYGNVTSKSVTGANGGTPRTTTMEYDATGRFVTKATDIEGLETNRTYNASTGNVLTETNPYNLTTTNVYDNWGRLSQTTDYLGNSSYRTFTKSGSDLIITETDDEGSETSTITNALGQKIEVLSKDVLGQLSGKAYQYDIYDRPVAESEPAIGGSYTQWNTTEYDDYGRVKKVTAFTGKVTNISYSGLQTTVNDGSKTVVTTKNALGQVLSTQDPGGTINNTYFANGNLKSADFAGSVQLIEQDGWGRKTKLTDPSAGVYTYSYNGFGEVTQETTPKGTTDYTYDANGKLTGKHIYDGSVTNITYTYTYNGSSKLLDSYTLSNADGNDATYNYTYDTYKRLLTTVEDNVQAKFSKTLTYDSFGRIATEASEAKNMANNRTASRTVLNTYAYGGLKKMSDNSTGTTIWEVTALNARGQVTTANMATSLKETNVYDQYGLPQEFKTERISGTPAELMKLSYSFDAQRGNLTDRSNTAFSSSTPLSESFTYDNLNRLTGFPDLNGTAQTQTYDSQGRINTNSRIGNYVYTGNSYQQAGLSSLTAWASFHYQGQPLQTITYNAFKSPVDIIEQGKESISFQYNAALGRSHMYYGSTSTDKMLRPYRRHYSEEGSMEITEDIATGSTSFVFYLGGDAYSAPAIWKEVQNASATTSSFYFLHRDYLGSILLITDVNGDVKEKRHFDAWGNISKLTDGNGNVLTAFAILDRGYTGHEHLFGVGLVHMNGRLYDPVLHRFLSPDNYVQDPGNTQNFNRYGYVMNNPLSRIDKDGEFLHIVIGAALGGIINLGIKVAQGKIHSFKDGAVAFGIGAVAGGVGAATGGAALAASGFTATSIAGGAIAGAAGAAFASPIQGLGNMAYFGDKYSLKSWVRDVAFGAVVGGIVGGISNRFSQPTAGSNGNPTSIWTGRELNLGNTNVEALQMTQFGNRVVDNSEMVQFGKVNNQIEHAFRHTDALGLDRELVESTVAGHVKTLSSQIIAGRPFNQVIEIAGQKIQYTAYRLPSGIINIGRIHGIP